MGTVLSFSQIKTPKDKKIWGYLESEGIEKYEDLLDLERAILEMLYIETENYLKDNHFDVRKFKLDEQSAKGFLSSDYMEALDGGEESLSISYIAIDNDVEYRTLAQAVFLEEEQVILDVNIYKKTDEGEWLCYVGENNWVEGPGKDFF